MFDSDLNLTIPDAIQENIADIDREFNQSIALSVSELSSLAEELSSYISELLSLDVTPLDSLLAMRDDIERLFTEDAETTDSVFPSSVFHTLQSIKENERAIFIDLLLEKLRESGVRLREEDFLLAGEAAPLFAYVKNTLADEAYDVITENVTDAKVRYVPSFSEGVKLLLNGDVGFCLLPIEEKGALRLPTVENLLFSEQLKIRRIVPVFGMDGSADLKYALVSRSAYIEPYQKEDDRYLELHIPHKTEQFSLSSFLFATGLHGMTLYRIHTVSIDRGGEREDYLSIVLKSQGESFVPMLSYLTLFCDRYSVVGIYKNLEY